MEIWYINFRKSLETLTSLDLYKQIVNRFKTVGYNFDIKRQSACLIFYPIMVESYCKAVVQDTDSVTAWTLSFKEFFAGLAVA